MYYRIQLHIESCDLWILPTTPLMPENTLKNSATFKRLFITKIPLGWNKLQARQEPVYTSDCILSYRFQMQQPHLTATVIIQKFSNSSMRIPVLDWKFRSCLKLSLATQGRMQMTLYFENCNCYSEHKILIVSRRLLAFVWTQHKN